MKTANTMNILHIKLKSAFYTLKVTVQDEIISIDSLLKILKSAGTQLSYM